VETEWASIIAADSVGALARARSRIVRAQLRAAPHATLFVAAHSDHASLIRDPEPAMIEAFGRRIRFIRPSLSA
jgi:hypothetical protein